jgi:hypothetical protein
MGDKCDATLGGNPCGFDAEYEVYDVVGDEFYVSCRRHIADVMEQNDFDRAEVEKL